MSQQTSRFNVNRQTLSLTTALGTTPELRYGEYANGMIFIPAASPITTLTYSVTPQAAGTAGSAATGGVAGTYLPAYDSAGINPVVQSVAAGRAYPLPVAIAGAAAFKIVVDVAGTVDLCLKS